MAQADLQTRRAFTDEVTNIGVVGGGAWGTALGMHCARMGHPVLVWAREEQVVHDINEESIRENTIFLKVGARSSAAAVMLECSSRFQSPRE